MEYRDQAPSRRASGRASHFGSLALFLDEQTGARLLVRSSLSSIGGCAAVGTNWRPILEHFPVKRI